MHKSDYKELKVWQKSILLTTEIYRLVEFLPREELYGLSSQLRRAAVSVPSNIAEGHGRFSDKEFIKFLSIAKGSLLEVETQLIVCVNLNLLSKEQTIEAFSLIGEVARMINALTRFYIKLAETKASNLNSTDQNLQTTDYRLQTIDS